MSTQQSKRAAREALLASAAMVGTDASQSAPVATPVVAMPAKGARKATKPATKVTKTHKAPAIPSSLDDMRADVLDTLAKGEVIGAQLDRNGQVLTIHVANAYARMVRSASNSSEVPSIANMYDKSTHAISKAGLDFMSTLCTAWLGKKVAKPSAKNGTSRADWNGYNTRAMRIRRAAEVFIAARGHLVQPGALWNEDASRVQVPSAIFLPVHNPKGGTAWTFSDPQTPDVVPLDGRVYECTRWVGPADDRKQERTGGTFSFSNVKDAFFTKPAHLRVKQAPADTTKTADSDASGKGADERTPLPKATVAKAIAQLDVFALLRAAADMFGDGKGYTTDDAAKSKRTLEHLRVFSDYYTRCSAELVARTASANAKRPPRTVSKPVVDCGTATPTTAQPIIDAVAA